MAGKNGRRCGCCARLALHGRFEISAEDKIHWVCKACQEQADDDAAQVQDARQRNQCDPSREPQR
jgi:hypothetical protein